MQKVERVVRLLIRDWDKILKTKSVKIDIILVKKFERKPNYSRFNMLNGVFLILIIVSAFG